jgi:hypothetical protein
VAAWLACPVTGGACGAMFWEVLGVAAGCWARVACWLLGPGSRRAVGGALEKLLFMISANARDRTLVRSSGCVPVVGRCCGARFRVMVLGSVLAGTFWLVGIALADEASRDIVRGRLGRLRGMLLVGPAASGAELAVPVVGIAGDGSENWGIGAVLVLAGVSNSECVPPMVCDGVICDVVAMGTRGTLLASGAVTRACVCCCVPGTCEVLGCDGPAPDDIGPAGTVTTY